MSTSRAIGTTSGATTALLVTQTSHGFSVGMPITRSAGGWVNSDAASSTLACDAVVSVVTDANNFTALLSGSISLTTTQWDAVTGGSGGLTDGEYYYLGYVGVSSGRLTKTPATTIGYNQVVLKATSTTNAVVLLPSDSFSQGSIINNAVAIAFGVWG